MGTFIYNSTLEIEIEDRALTHLQIVIIDKFRRDERFAASFRNQGRAITIWLTSRSPLEFVYAGNRVPSVNHDWLEALSDVAGMSGVLRIVNEPLEHARSVPAEPDRDREPAVS